MPKLKLPKQLGINPVDLRLEGGKSTLPRLKVWWIPQVPMKSFDVHLNSFAQAKVLLEALGQYDLFQLDNRIKPDYSNTGGLCIWDESLDRDDNGEYWTEWESEEFDTIDEITLAQCVQMDKENGL